MSAAKQASESKSGRHSQSIDPRFVTRAAVPHIAYQRVILDAGRLFPRVAYR